MNFACWFLNTWVQTEEAWLDLGMGAWLTMWSDMTLINPKAFFVYEAGAKFAGMKDKFGEEVSLQREFTY